MSIPAPIFPGELIDPLEQEKEMELEPFNPKMAESILGWVKDFQENVLWCEQKGLVLLRFPQKRPKN